MKQIKMAKLREDAKLSQKDLAAKAGIDVITVNRIERGDVEPTLKQAMAIAKALDAQIEEVFIFECKSEKAPMPNIKDIAGQLNKGLKLVVACGDFLQRPEAYDEAIAEYNKANPEANLHDVTEVVGFFDMVLDEIKQGNLVYE